MNAIRHFGLLLLMCVAACAKDPAAADGAAKPGGRTGTTSDAPAINAPAQPQDPIGFAGYGSAAFGSNEALLRAAWAGTLQGAGDSVAEVTSCHFLIADPRPAQGRGIAFMFEDRRLVRYDVDTAHYVAPGGIRTGMRVEAVFAAFPGKVQEQSDKYLPGARDLIIVDPAGSNAKLIVDVDADGIVSSWRIGVPPQVDYVEGCG